MARMTPLTGEDKDALHVKVIGGSSQLCNNLDLYGFSAGGAPPQVGTASGESCSATDESTAPCQTQNLRMRFLAGM